MYAVPFWWTVSRFGETKHGSATSANEIEIEDGVIRVHVFGERGCPSLHRLRYGLLIEFGRMDKENPTRLEHFSQNSPIRLRPVRMRTL